MDEPETQIINASEARQALTDGDIRSDIAFQNDVNRLLALLDELWDGRTQPAPLTDARGARSAGPSPSVSSRVSIVAQVGSPSSRPRNGNSSIV